MRRAAFLITSTIMFCILYLNYGSVVAQGGVNVVTLDQVRLRGGPGTSFDTVTVIPFNTALVAVGRNETFDWVKVNYNGQFGWISARFVRFQQGKLADLPVGDGTTPVSVGGTDPVAVPTGPVDGSLIELSPYGYTDT